MVMNDEALKNKLEKCGATTVNSKDNINYEYPTKPLIEESEDEIIIGSGSLIIKKDIGKPIMEFKNNKELNDCLRWWQDKLMLNDWIITAKLSEKMLDLDGLAVEGLSECYYTTKTAYIDIVTKNCVFEYIEKDKSDRNIKFCHEHILLHELFHIMFPAFESKNPQMQDLYFDMTQHQLIESLAKTLLMTKYNLTLDWFYDESYMYELLGDDSD